MRKRSLIFGLILICSCKKSTESVATRLLRTEFTPYNGDVFYIEYGYDNQGRITTITNHKNGEEPVVAVTIAYNNGEAILLSHPETDPVYDQTKEVHLELGPDGQMLKRIEYTHAVAKPPAVQPTEKFSYDTLKCAYNVSGFLNNTTESRYDSTWVDPTFYEVSRLTSTVSYTIAANKLITTDQSAVYPRITNNNGVITVSGGSSEYHYQFKYSKSFPNSMDFKNAAVLNEYAIYYEPWLNIHYTNIPDQVIISSTDKDVNGSVIFTGNSIVDIERKYNADGLLFMDSVLSHNTAYPVIKYFYGR